jgi:hypothetical protein
MDGSMRFVPACFQRHMSTPGSCCCWPQNIIDIMLALCVLPRLTARSQLIPALTAAHIHLHAYAPTICAFDMGQLACRHCQVDSATL